MSISQFGESLHCLFHAYRRALREGYEAAGIGLSVSQIRVLKSVAARPDASARDIGHRMNQDKGRIARLLKSLEMAALIERWPDPADQRSRRLSLTAAGRTLRERIRTIEAEAGARLAGDLSPERLADFAQTADALIANLEPESDHAR